MSGTWFNIYFILTVFVQCNNPRKFEAISSFASAVMIFHKQQMGRVVNCEKRLFDLAEFRLEIRPG